MKTIQLMKVLGLTLLAANQAIAADIPYSTADFCNLHYSEVAYGKKVNSVFVHTGVLTCSERFDSTTNTLIRDEYWESVSDVQMTKNPAENSSFVSNIVLKAKSSLYNTCALKPIVQFWVTFDDGSTKIEQPRTVEIAANNWIDYDSADVPEKIVIDIRDFFKVNPIRSVGCTRISSYGNGSYRFADIILDKIQ
jgi:hypothetical protein